MRKFTIVPNHHRRQTYNGHVKCFRIPSLNKDSRLYEGWIWHASWRFSPYRAVNTVSVVKTSHLVLCREKVAVCSQIHTKYINTLCGQNVEFLNVKLAYI